MELQEAIQGFLLSLSVEGKSPNYVEWCGHILSVFRRWAGPRKVADIRPDDVKQYIHYLQTEHIPYGEGHPLHRPTNRLSPHSIKAHWAVLSAFFAWAAREGIVERNIMADVRRPKTPKLLKVGFTAEEVRRLIKAAEAKGGQRAARELKTSTLTDSVTRRPSSSCEMVVMCFAQKEIEKGLEKKRGCQERKAPSSLQDN